MRIKKWLGWISNASPYALPPGANTEQCNLQNVVPGQLKPRGGVTPVPNSILAGNFSSGFTASIFSMFRIARPRNLADQLLIWHNRTLRLVTTSTSTVLTVATGAHESGTQNVFANSGPINFCQDRFGNIYMFQGNGYRPLRWNGDPNSTVHVMGVDAPASPPSLSRAAGDDGYYIERVDVIDGGGAYWAPPSITINGTLNTGGTAARLRAVVEAGEVTAVEVLDPGHNYKGPVTLSFDTTTAAPNTFSAVANLATTVTPGSFGITLQSAQTTTGSLTASHTLAIGKNNASVSYYTGNTTTGTPNSVNASLINGVWVAANIPLYKTSNNADSSARVTLTFSNIAYSFTSGTVYGLDAYQSATTPSTNYNVAGYTFCEPPGFFQSYPKVTVPGSGQYYDLRYDSSQAKFYADVVVTGGTGTIRVYFDYNTSSFTQAGYGHPDFGGGTITTWALPSKIASSPSPSVLTAGSGYSVTNATVKINQYKISDYSLTGQTLDLSFTTKSVGTTTSTLDMPGALVSVSAVTNQGSGLVSGDSAYVQLASRLQSDNATTPSSYSTAQKLQLTAVETTASVTTLSGAIASVTVNNGGSNLLVAPEIFYTGGGGYGLVLQASVSGGSIPTGTSGVTVIDGGAGFTSAPTLFIKTGGATATAIMRPTMTGLYQCAYRYVDGSVPPSQGGPIYSNFSPIAEYNAGPALAYRSTNTLQWQIPVQAVPARATAMEFWRTSSEQALVFYRSIIGISPTIATTPNSVNDSLSDEQLFDPDRDVYAALPVVLPNGALNAYRFGVVRSDMSACVAFQDRLWYGVSTSGLKTNSLFYSEYDEFESCPDTNELVIQQNITTPDTLSALIPFGGQLLAMQQMHCYSLTYINDPAEDANLQLIGYRGCWNQRCWEVFEGLLYVADSRGIYSMSASGQIESLSEPVEDLFETKIVRRAGYEAGDLAADNFVFLKIDPITRVLRLFCTLLPDSSDTTHQTAVCYHLDSKTWWVERYPRSITSATSLKDSSGRISAIYSSVDRVMYLDNGYTDWASGTITGVTITNAGTGYTSPPTITAPSGTHAIFEAVLDGRGGIRAVVVKFGGRGYVNGNAITVTGGGGSGCTGTISAVTTTASGTSTVNGVSIPWWFKTGNMEIVTDRESSRNDGEMSRAIALTYKPTADARNAHLRLYYNNSANARPNFALRNRGTGFVEDITGSSSVLNMQSARTELGPATGVSIARFAGRGIDDATGNDRHVAVEISSDQPTVRVGSEANAAIVYELDVQGVADG